MLKIVVKNRLISCITALDSQPTAAKIYVHRAVWISYWSNGHGVKPTQFTTQIQRGYYILSFKPATTGQYMSLIFFLIKDIRSFYSPPEFFKRQRLDSALLPLEALGCFARSVTALTLMNNFTFPIFFSVRVRCFYKFVAFLSLKWHFKLDWIH